MVPPEVEWNVENRGRSSAKSAVVEKWTSTLAKSAGACAPPVNVPSQDTATPPRTEAITGADGTGGVGPLTAANATVPSLCTPMLPRSAPASS
jgi:hypothetical protein